MGKIRYFGGGGKCQKSEKVNVAVHKWQELSVKGGGDKLTVSWEDSITSLSLEMI